MADTIKDYLVALGFDVNMASYNKMQGVLKELDSKVKISTSEMATNYVKAGSVIISTFVSIGAAAVDLVDKIARADLGYQKFAMRMYMTRDAAKQLKIVTDAMGESLEDIAWIPELNKRYQTLMGEARAMETPRDAKGQLEYIRDIRFEFTRMKVEATYGLQWIGYYLFKYLNNPLGGTKFGLKEINDWIQRNLPVIADKIAKFLANLYQLASHAWIPIKGLFGVLKDFFDSLPDWGRQLVIFGGIFLAFFLTGPIGRAMIIIGSFILLWDDFWVHVRGGEGDPTLGPIWDTLIEKVYWLESHIVKLSYYFSNFWADLRKNGWLAGPLNGLLDPNKPNRMDKGVEERWAEWKKNNPPPTPGSPGRPATYKGREIGGTPQEQIGGLESGGRYGIWGPQSKYGRAFGKYQILEANIPKFLSWAGLDPRTPISQITPEMEEKMFQAAYVDRYMKWYGDTGARIAWHAGEGAAEKWMKGDNSVLKRKDSLGTSTEEYIKRSGGRIPSGETRSFMDGVPNYQPQIFGGAGPLSRETIQNNFNINLYGKDSDQQVREVEKIIQKYNSKEASVYNRFPAIGGVTP